MTEKIKAYREFLIKREYRNVTKGTLPVAASNDDSLTRAAEVFEQMLAAQEPKFYPFDRFGFNYTYTRPAPRVRNGNLTPDYEGMLTDGFAGILQRIENARAGAAETETEFLDACERTVQATLTLCERYRVYAEEQGLEELAASLSHVPMYGARSLYEALVVLKLMQFTLRLADVDHIGLGRMDQYLYPYYLKEQNDEDVLELIEEFFISLNLDSYLYSGVQQGDNGQSLMLGGKGTLNELGKIILKASAELCLIDPKINLRVDQTTPFEVYRLGTELTKKGLGFPQYCNDDIVIPALEKLGYAPEDARNYTVAACWEFIIPGKSGDIPNRGCVDFPRIVREVTLERLHDCENFDKLLQMIETRIAEDCREQIEKGLSRYDFPVNPYLSLFVRPCIERRRDFADHGAQYINMGFHGVGISDAAGALYATKKAVFDEQSVTAERLKSALENDFAGESALQNQLRAYPKMGDNDDGVDAMGAFLMECYSKYMNGVPDGAGGTCRAGTGSAMEYVRLAKKLGATADGRGANKPYACSFSPSLSTATGGPLSVIASFSKHPLTDICNGGPLTIELHHNVFRNSDGEAKVATLVKRFIDRGGHQLQLNAVDPDRLTSALECPEEHRDLIVRVWGWSGRFVELDKEYQQHIIARTKYGV